MILLFDNQEIYFLFFFSFDELNEVQLTYGQNPKEEKENFILQTDFPPFNLYACSYQLAMKIRDS